MILTQAFILAAGQGQRLSGVLPDRPKGFLEFAGRSLIERSILQLRRAGIHDIVIVIGYGATYYEALAERTPGIRLVRNDAFATTGSLHSLHCAAEFVTDSFLLLESDLIYESRALQEILACPHPNAILMSGFTHSGDEVYMDTDGERVRKLSKNQTELTNITGELVGITRICPTLFAALIRYAVVCLKENPLAYYEDGINGITGETDVFHHRVDDLVWAEIDTPEHLKRVKERILPRLDVV